MVRHQDLNQVARLLVVHFRVAIQFVSVVASLLEFGRILGNGDADPGGMRQIRRAQKGGVLRKQDRPVGSREHRNARFIGLIEGRLVIIHGQRAIVSKDVIGAGGNPGSHELARFLRRFRNARVRQRIFQARRNEGDWG